MHLWDWHLLSTAYIITAVTALHTAAYAANAAFMKVIDIFISLKEHQQKED